MDTTTPESHDRLRQAIVDEIDSLEAAARAFKSRYNELAPISRLPCEVLAAIFTFLSASAWERRQRYVYFECMDVTHVCRRWRETALNHPRF